MATQEIQLTDAWVNATSQLSLSAGTTYNIQVQGRVRVAESANAPTTIGGRLYQPYQEFPYTASASENLWIKSDSEGSLGTLVVDEA